MEMIRGIIVNIGSRYHCRGMYGDCRGIIVNIGYRYHYRGTYGDYIGIPSLNPDP